MRISIITVCYNSAQTIRDSIESVLSQNYSEIEYIVVDGGSTDGTLGILEEYRESIDIFVSGPDQGIYDAMNKGIKRATGDVVGLLNSDDLFAKNSVLRRVAKEFEEVRVDAVFGDLVYVRSNDPSKVVRNWKSSEYYPGAFSKGWHPAHPTFYVRRKVYQELGGFDTRMKVSADFEIMMRFLEVGSISSSYIPETLVLMRTGGESNKSIRNILVGNRYIYEAFRKHGIRYPWLYFPKRIFRKFLQYRIGHSFFR